eukprot:TRINITY_DN1179_c0_g1_i5.p1 TRINITY_DN1179_c0_g1~~TRINITY_DN1179_c0_g1_i5.p1  ORF type:complete len:195 (-),score=4.17 TRINITY_DN1179_c0_g1_i5:23-607(-)
MATRKQARPSAAGHQKLKEGNDKKRRKTSRTTKSVGGQRHQNLIVVVAAHELPRSGRGLREEESKYKRSSLVCRGFAFRCKKKKSSKVHSSDKIETVKSRGRSTTDTCACSFGERRMGDWSHHVCGFSSKAQMLHILGETGTAELTSLSRRTSAAFNSPLCLVLVRIFFFFFLPFHFVSSFFFFFFSFKSPFLL